MAKRFTFRLPTPEQLKKQKIFSRFGETLFAKDLWSKKRKGVQRAFAISLFSASLPIPLQMVLVAFLAVKFRANLPIALGLVWITNPLTQVPITLLEFWIGVRLLGLKKPQELDENQMSEMMSEMMSGNNLTEIFLPIVAGSIVLGLSVGVLAYLIVGCYYRWKILAAWRRRHQA